MRQNVVLTVFHTQNTCHHAWKTLRTSEHPGFGQYQLHVAQLSTSLKGSCMDQFQDSGAGLGQPGPDP